MLKKLVTLWELGLFLLLIKGHAVCRLDREAGMTQTDFVVVVNA